MTIIQSLPAVFLCQLRYPYDVDVHHAAVKAARKIGRPEVFCYRERRGAMCMIRPGLTDEEAVKWYTMVVDDLTGPDVKDHLEAILLELRKANSDPKFLETVEQAASTATNLTALGTILGPLYAPYLLPLL